MIRCARPDDDLQVLLGPSYAGFAWNPKQVIVADMDGMAVGCVMLWDSGHDIVRADCLNVLPAYQHHGLGIKLAHAVYEYAQRQKRKIIVFNLTSIETAYSLQKLGGQSGGTIQIMWFPVTEQSPLRPKESVHV